MEGAPDRVLIALDHNFPEPILACLRDFLPEHIDLRPLRLIDARLPDLDDRPMLIALHQLGFPALVTNNYKILKNPEELAAVLKTKLTVIAIEGTGDDPLRATGALLLDLPGIVKQIHPGVVFWMRPRNPRPDKPWELFERAAEHRHEASADLYEAVKVTNEELAKPVLE